MTSIREIKLLKEVDHPCIVNLKTVAVGDKPDSVFLVFEYCDYDCSKLLRALDSPFNLSEIKYILRRILEGLQYLHDHFIIHRDLKLSNILVNSKGEVKLADLGLARKFGHPLQPYTPNVVTMWYRPPELFLGSEKYHTAIDLWSLGCIFAELLDNKPLFDGSSEMEQMNLIFSLLGTPNDIIWPGYSNLVNSSKMEFAQNL